MPHVEILGGAALQEVHDRFEPRSVRDGQALIKAAASYLAHDRLSLLLDCLVVEGYLHQHFFVLLTAREGGAMVRLLPRTSPEKTDGVKRCVVWISQWLREGRPGASVGTTNLDGILSPAVAEEARPGDSRLPQRRGPTPPLGR